MAGTGQQIYRVVYLDIQLLLSAVLLAMRRVVRELSAVSVNAAPN
jgi:hypothetical protein